MKNHLINGESMDGWTESRCKLFFIAIRQSKYTPHYPFCDPLNLCLVCRRTHVTSTTSPVNVDILALLVLGIRELRLDLEGMRTEVITLRLEQVGGQVLGTVTVEP